ncbi:MAG: hypothetical protein J4G13_10275, partial [Dehalococcoidia bacterium]|nr:hypothetical protein [Dehalococcoidia bacterium]
RTVMLRGDDLDTARLEEEFHGMEQQARAELVDEGLRADDMTPRRFLDVRYVGQSFELTVECPPLVEPGDLTAGISSDFYEAHLQRFGYADAALPIEVVNLRLKLELAMDKPQLEPAANQGSDSAPAVIGNAEVVFADGPVATTLYNRDLLQTGNRIAGPALLLQLDTTIVVPPGWNGEVDPYGNLLLEPDALDGSAIS